MKRWIKIFAVWVIAIAIPMQGIASVAMMNCMQTPHEHSQEFAAEHHHDAAEVDDQVSQDKAKAKHACAHCVKCTNCCSGFTFQSTAPHLFQQLSVSQSKFNYRTLLFTGFIPSGLERPPRPSLV